MAKKGKSRVCQPNITARCNKIAGPLCGCLALPLLSVKWTNCSKVEQPAVLAKGDILFQAKIKTHVNTYQPPSLILPEGHWNIFHTFFGWMFFFYYFIFM